MNNVYIHFFDSYCEEDFSINNMTYVATGKLLLIENGIEIVQDREYTYVYHKYRRKIEKEVFITKDIRKLVIN